MLRFFILIAIIASTHAQALTLDKKLPSLTIKNKGMLTLNDKKFSYQPWDSNNLKPKRWLIQHIAPLPIVSEYNVRISELLNAIDVPKNNCRTITIINVDEAIWGTRPFIYSKLKKSLKLNPKCQIVADAEGTARQQWQLKKKGNYVAVIDEQQHVLFLQEGKLSDKQITTVMSLLGVYEQSVSQHP